MRCEPPHPLSRVSGTVVPCIAAPLLPCCSPRLPFPFFLFSEQNFYAQSNTKTITFATSFPFGRGGRVGLGGKLRAAGSRGSPATSRANWMKGCFPGLLALLFFFFFSSPNGGSCKDGTVRAVARSFRTRERAWKTRGGTLAVSPHPSSLVMAGGTRATCSLFIWLHSLKMPQIGDLKN